MSKARGVKLSMGEFLGDTPSTSSLPKGPGEGSDGGGTTDRESRGYGRGGGYGSRGGPSNNRSNDDSQEQGSWRRGGGGDRGRSSDFGDNRRSGGGGRGGYSGRGGGGGFDDYKRGGGSGGGGGFDDFRRRGGGNDNRGAPESSSGGQRPKLNLSKRTKPIESATQVPDTMKKTESSAFEATSENIPKIEGNSNKAPPSDTKSKKSNPFGDATAVDTASKLRDVESKFEKMDIHASEPKDDTREAKESSPEAKEEVSQPTTFESEGSKSDESNTVPLKTEMKFSDVARSAKELPHESLESKHDGNNEPKAPTKRVPKEEPKISNSRAAALDDGGNRGPPLDKDKEKKSGGGTRNQDQNKKNRGPPPQPVNSRFAAAAAADKEYMERNASRDRHESSKRENKPTRNSRFDSLMESENKDVSDAPAKDEQRPKTPPPLTENMRFASMVSDDDADQEDGKNGRERSRNEKEFGPPEPQNSRFAAAAAMAESNRSEFSDRPRGPPPVQQNSRFTKAIEADQDYGVSRESRPDRSFGDRQQGPPPVQQNSRFTRAMEADQDYGASRESRPERQFNDREQGPPPVQQNSRFTKAMEADKDYGASRERGERGPGDRGDRDRERSGYYGRRDERGPPPVANSRFAAAVESDPDYRERGEREDDERRGGDRDRDRSEGRFGDNRGGGGRWGEGGGRDDFRDRRGPGRFNRRGDGEVRNEELPRFPGSRQQEEQPVIAKVEDFPSLKTLNKADLPKAAAPPPKVTAPIALPGETEEEALARIEKKKKEDAEKKAAEEAEAKRFEEERQKAAKEAQEVAEKAKAAEGKILDDFASGEKQGDALTNWCSEQGALLPPIEKLICHFLDTTQKKNPDIKCAWAAPDKYGKALLSLCQDNVRNQMGVLWGIQYYCDNIGFPKLGEERVVQAMFRSMYSFDIVDEEGFFEWKEDESDEHSTGKLTAIVQTVDWFNWLEEEEDEEDEEEYEE